MRYQLLTGLCSSIVCLIVLQIQSNLIAQLWSNQIFLPIISGIFVYISTVHLIPEVMESNYGIKGSIFKVTAFIVSGYIIFYLKKYE
jgi:zinc transporter ZupT